MCRHGRCHKQVERESRTRGRPWWCKHSHQRRTQRCQSPVRAGRMRRIYENKSIGDPSPVSYVELRPLAQRACHRRAGAWRHNTRVRWLMFSHAAVTNQTAACARWWRPHRLYSSGVAGSSRRALCHQPVLILQQLSDRLEGPGPLVARGCAPRDGQARSTVRRVRWRVGGGT